MEVITPALFRLRKKEFLQKIREGAVFIHPTDTIYGLGCTALLEKAVLQIRQLKERQSSPFSIWVPSRAWVEENCLVPAETRPWLDKLPGPYTLILPLKNKNALAPSVTAGKKTIGIRLPQHWFSAYVQELGFPLITTSANKAGAPFMTKLEDLDPDVAKGVEFIISEGEKNGRPSTIINLMDKSVKER